MRHLLPVLLCLSVFAPVSLVRIAPAHAAGDREKARLHYEQGEKYYRQGEFQSALEAYKKVLEYVDSAEMYYNIGQCHRMLKEYEKALFFYRRYLSNVPNAPHREMVERHIAAMTAELEAQRAVPPPPDAPPGPGKVIVMVQPPGSLVWVDTFDGRHVGTTPTVLDLEPGKHVILVRKDGFFKKTFPVEVRPRELATVEASLEADPDAIAPQPVPPTREDGADLWLWSGVAGSVLFAAATGTFGYLAWSKNQDWKRSYAAADRDDGQLYGNLATGFAVLTVGLAAVTIWAALAKDDPPNRKRDRRAWFVAPACSGDGCGLAFTLEF